MSEQDPIVQRVHASAERGRAVTTTLPHMVDPALARSIRNAADKVSHWTAERDRLVSEAIHAGGTLREVAVLAGLTHTGVAKIERRTRG